MPPIKQTELAAAIRTHVRPGMHLHFASTPSRSNAAIREVARAFRETRPEFVLSTSGFHSMAHLLGVLRLGRRYIACFFGDNYPNPRPNRLYRQLQAEGAELEHWSLLSYVTALRAGALGHAYGVTRSLRGSTLGAELAALGRIAEVPDPLDPDGAPLVLVRAMRPQITFVHAPLGDTLGNIVAAAPESEGYWAAAGATVGTIATVERVVEPAVLAAYADRIKVPRQQVLAVCHEPFGAHPQPMYTGSFEAVSGYADDFDHYELWRTMTADPELQRCFAAQVLAARDGRAGYRAFVEQTRLAAPGPRAVALDEAAAQERLTIAAARLIAERVRQGGYRTILAGIGQAFLAARLARLELAAAGIDVAVVVETGLVDVECGPSAHPFLLGHRNIAQAGRLSSVEDALGTLVCGADNRCLGIIGAAQVDVRGHVNSTRLSGGELLVGSGGANDIASSAAEVVVLARSAAGRLVPAVDHITSPGCGVRHVVTDRCVLSREHAGAPWELRAPFVTAGEGTAEVLAAIREHCPWDYTVAPSLTPASPIHEHERRMFLALSDVPPRSSDEGAFQR